ncbi:hypothetical protein BG011_009622 [Mortierella polycephala]|uniref:TPX2 C-terminal domain-containing protein n=1 Tax=Mortierella polycephala TaxID=41804 RepID=A0A9P6PP08_9FUNG|nr:hypothetical protein BG011_009622 [Mortierella polycephala]
MASRKLTPASGSEAMSTKNNRNASRTSNANASTASTALRMVEGPFLGQPPRKIFKATTNQESNNVTKQALIITDKSLRTPASRRQHQKLALTRVLPMNASHINSPKGKGVSRPSVAAGTDDSNPFMSGTFTASAVVSSATSNIVPNDNGGVASHSSSQHPNTTPKQQPKVDYLRFLRQSTTEGGISTDKESEAERSDGLLLPEMSRKSFGASTMDFARRSIMHHATASPQSAFMKVNRVAAESHGKPSLLELLTASDMGDDEVTRSQQQTSQMLSEAAPKTTRAETESSRKSMRESFAKPDTPFTFESMPLPSHDASPHTSGSGVLSKSVLNTLENQQEQGSDHIGATTSFALHTGQQDSSTNEQGSFNLRAALRMDASRGHHGVADNEPTIATRYGTARRTGPYKVPTVNEREALRSSRISGFRARPIDPKVFTSAGDLGVPRIRKLPLTIPVSPQFSKPRVKKIAMSSTSNLEPVKTAVSTRLAAMIRSKPARRLPARPQQQQTHGTDTVQHEIVQEPSAEHNHDHPREIIAESGNEPTNEHGNDLRSTTRVYPSSPAGRLTQRTSIDRFYGMSTGAQKSFRGPPVRLNEPRTTIATTSETSVTDGAEQHGRLHGGPMLRRPLTQPVPFKFATDDILRRRHVMFRPKPTPAPPATVSRMGKTTEGNKASSAGALRRSQPSLKRLTDTHKHLTIPVSFQLATQRRAEMRPYETRHNHAQETSAEKESMFAPSTSVRRASRLAGLVPLSVSRGAGGDDTTAPNHAEDTHHFVPTVPISPKFGRRVPVSALRPTRFVLKKSTKELTQPHEFHFQSEQRAKDREAYELSIKRRELELTALKQKSAKLEKEREQRMRLRESLERTYRARPIKKYMPTTIHKATKPLTRPMSPMIGEKRKRHEMEMQLLEQQQQQQEQAQLGYEAGEQEYDNTYIANSNLNEHEQEIYRQFEEAKILQEEHEALQQKLAEQERRQLELANSSNATIHQPPIRLSFPLDPEIEALQSIGSATATATTHHGNDEYTVPSENVGPALSSKQAERTHQTQETWAQVRDSFEASENRRLSRELRRISLEASRGSGGIYRKRLSDNASIGSGGSGGGRRSLENRAMTTDHSHSAMAEYYPFTRSLAQTGTSAATSASAVSSSSVTTTTPSKTTSSTLPIVSSRSFSLSNPAPSLTGAVRLSYPASISGSHPGSSSTAPFTSAFASTTRPAASTTEASTTAADVSRAANCEKDESRRRSGSFIPLDLPASGPLHTSRISLDKHSILSSKLFGQPPRSKATLSSAAVRTTSSHPDTAMDSSLGRSKGPMVIEHTLKLGDL